MDEPRNSRPCGPNTGFPGGFQGTATCPSQRFCSHHTTHFGIYPVTCPPNAHCVWICDDPTSVSTYGSRPHSDVLSPMPWVIESSNPIGALLAPSHYLNHLHRTQLMLLGTHVRGMLTHPTAAYWSLANPFPIPTQFAKHVQILPQ